MAAAARDEGAGEPLPLLTPEYQAGLAVFTRRYFERLFAQLKPPFAVVFDGYHEVPASSPLQEVLRIALEALPPGGRILIVSRGDPPASMARLRAHQTLSVLGWDELRLTREEAGSIVAQRKLALGAEARRCVVRAHAGLGGGPGADARASARCRRDRRGAGPADAPAGVRLLRRRDLPQGRRARAAIPAAHGLSARDDHAHRARAERRSGTGELLASLTRNNYFVSLRETQPEPVYQYHPMLRDFLQARAGEALPKERRRDLQRRSAAQMEQAGRIEDAVALYRDCHDWDDMARLIEVHAAALLAQGRGETLARWVEELPAEVQTRHPWTLYWAAASQAQLTPRESRLLYEKAFDLFRSAGDGVGTVLAASGAMFAILYELDDCSLLDRWIAVLDEADKGGVPLPSPAVEARVACSMFIALTLRQPQRRDMKQWIERALAAAAGAGGRQPADVRRLRSPR